MDPVFPLGTYARTTSQRAIKFGRWHKLVWARGAPLRSQGAWSQRANPPSYAYTLLRRTSTFNRLTHVGRDVFLVAQQRPIPMAGVLRIPILMVLLLLCQHLNWAWCMVTYMGRGVFYRINRAPIPRGEVSSHQNFGYTLWRRMTKFGMVWLTHSITVP